uniref:NADH-ubiquinone oxidoreductase chain 4L n=1 Tax=Coreidae sp. EMHAU-2015-Zz052308 TaxID=2038648 RepID=A0A343K688_9HEMI|nr:NADH dehydrogenase subunit 4L [Coreidae sp. EMHAU-2015-Zz052308]
MGLSYILNNLFFLIFTFMAMLTFLVFVSSRKHLLLTLLSLEFLVLVVFVALSFTLFYFYNEMYFMLIYLTLTVCEGAVGLAILVSLIRCKGNDNIQSLSFLLW